MHAHGKKILYCSLSTFYSTYDIVMNFSMAKFYINLVVMHIHNRKSICYAYTVDQHEGFIPIYYYGFQSLFYLDSQPLVFENTCIGCTHLKWRGLWTIYIVNSLNWKFERLIAIDKEVLLIMIKLWMITICPNWFFIRIRSDFFIITSNWYVLQYQ